MKINDLKNIDEGIVDWALRKGIGTDAAGFAAQKRYDAQLYQRQFQDILSKAFYGALQSGIVELKSTAPEQTKKELEQNLAAAKLAADHDRLATGTNESILSNYNKFDVILEGIISEEESGALTPSQWLEQYVSQSAIRYNKDISRYAKVLKNLAKEFEKSVISKKGKIDNIILEKIYSFWSSSMYSSPETKGSSGKSSDKPENPKITPDQIDDLKTTIQKHSNSLDDSRALTDIAYSLAGALFSLDPNVFKQIFGNSELADKIIEQAKQNAAKKQKSQ